MDRPAASTEQCRSSRALTLACALAAAVLIFISTLELELFRARLELRAAVLLLGLVPAALFLFRLFPTGSITRSNRLTLLAVIFVTHLLATLYFFPAADLVNNRPVVTLDHSFHYYQAYQTREVFRQTYRVDRYDPFFMAGYPGGTIFDLDMKGAELFCAVCPFLDVARCLKLFILGVYLLMAGTLYWGSRLQGFKLEESFWGLMVFLAYWHWGRPYAGDFRYAGMFSFVCATHLCFLMVGLVRHLPRKKWIKTFFIVGPLAFLVHPTSLIMLPVPLLASIVVYHRSWRLSTFLLLVAWGAGVVFLNYVWLEPFFKYIWIKTTTETYYQIHGCGDLLALVARPTCSIALAVIVLALTGVWRLAREKRLQAGLPVLAASVFLFFVAGAGIYLWGFNQLEPGRFLFGGFLFLAPLSGAGFYHVSASLLARVNGERPRALLKTALLTSLVLVMLPLSMLESKSFYRHTISTTFPPRVASLIEAVKTHVADSGRLMIEDLPAAHYGEVHLPALLPLITGIEQIGGPYPHTFLLYHFATFEPGQTFGRPMDRWDAQSIKPYLDLYNVRWILTAKKESGEYVAGWFGADPVWTQGTYKLWKLEPPAQASGGGPVVTGAVNRITIENARAAESYVLNYHWVPGLSVTPPARIYATGRLRDPVPFIVVEPNGASCVEITY